MGDRLMTRAGRRGETFALDAPCPRCGNATLIGYLFYNERGEHMHTRYVCTFWPTALGLSEWDAAAPGPCDWAGWSVPEAKSLEAC